MFLWICMTKIGSPSLDMPVHYCVYILKFCVWEQSMRCALEINSNGGFKRGHVDSCPSATKNMSPLPPTKLGWVVTYQEGLPPIKSHDPLIIWFCKIIWQTKIIITPLPKWLWSPDFAGSWLALMGSCKVTWPFYHMFLWGHVTKDDYISTTTVPMATKPGSVVTCLKRSPSHKVI